MQHPEGQILLAPLLPSFCGLIGKRLDFDGYSIIYNEEKKKKKEKGKGKREHFIEAQKDSVWFFL